MPSHIHYVCRSRFSTTIQSAAREVRRRIYLFYSSPSDIMFVDDNTGCPVLFVTFKAPICSIMAEVIFCDFKIEPMTQSEFRNAYQDAWSKGLALPSSLHFETY